MEAIEKPADNLELKKEPIALIGCGCRFPGGADGPDGFWRLLKDRVDGVGEIPAERWDPDYYYHPDPARPGKVYTRGFGALQGIDLFDAEFFGISPREASRMDPQQRLLLEVAWEALEDAGLVTERLAGSDTGVFVGVSNTDYANLQFQDLNSVNAYTNAGGAPSIAANRISYFFDLHGPSMAIDTACSSALVAIHLACQAIWTGESNLALAGGVNVLVRPGPFVGFSKASMLSPTGRCRSFDAAGDGYVRSDGVGIVVLKPLSQALEEDDPIYALIVGTGVNSDGRTTGLSLPNQKTQEKLLRQVYGQAGVPTQQVYYVEAHGTGTPVGDPIECRSLGSVLGASRGPDRPCRIGSVKTNIGHSEPAAGAAGLIKVALSLKHGELPASLLFSEPNPEIPFQELNLKVQTKAAPLPRDEGPIIMGVNSFGFGGANAHVVLKQFVPPTGASRVRTQKKPRVLFVSARSQDALTDLARAYLHRFRSQEGVALDDICFSAALRRTHHQHRLAIVGDSEKEMAQKLESFIDGEGPSDWVRGQSPHERESKLAFVFAGNGCQWQGMGSELLKNEPVFQKAVESIDRELRKYADWSLLKELQVKAPHSRLESTEFAQPLLFGVQVGLLELLRSWGVEPGAAFGHSVGEVAAAYACGALSFEQAVRVIHERSRAQELTAGEGKMAAAALSREDAEKVVAGYGQRISLAAINSPTSVTLSGEVDALQEVGHELESQGVFFRMLDLDYAFHSRVMDRLKDPLLEALDGLAPALPRIPFVSAVTGQAKSGPGLDATYWWDNIRKPVRFAEAVDGMIEDGFTTFVEIGAHPILGGYLLECLRARDQKGTVLGTLRRQEPECAALLSSVGGLYGSGAFFDMERLFPKKGKCVSLPSYPWQRQHHWNTPSQEAATPQGRHDHPLLGFRLASAQGLWDQRLDTRLCPFLRDHSVQGAVVFPAAGYVEMGLAASKRLSVDRYELEGVDIQKPLVLSDKNPPRVQTAVNEEDSTFKIYSRSQSDDAGWTVHVAGKLVPMAGISPSVRSMSLKAIRDRCPLSLSKEDHYRIARSRGLEYGPTFQGVERVWIGKGEALGRVKKPQALDRPENGYTLHPSILDGCFQVVLGVVPPEQQSQGRSAYLPVRIERFRFYRSPKKVVYCHVQLQKEGPRSLVINCSLLDPQGRVLAEVLGLRFQAVDLSRQSSGPRGLYEFTWRLQPRRDQKTRRDASFLPGLRVLAGRVASNRVEAPVRQGRSQLDGQFQVELNRLCAAYAAQAVAKLGQDGNSAESFTITSLLAGGGVDRRYEPLLRTLVRMLQQDEILVGGDGGWKLSPGLPTHQPKLLWRRLARDFPAYHAELMLLGRCGERLAGVLRGQIDPGQLVAPEKGPATLEHLYDSSPTARRYNALAGEVVREAAQAWPPDRTLRVLEIGGGTGGATAALLAGLPEDRSEYVFTDISEEYLARTEGKFSHYPFMSYQPLDIECDPATAGLDHHSFDLIIASNVLHATGNLHQSLENIRLLLASGGLLLIAEQPPQRLSDLTFGLLDWWWQFDDVRGSARLLEPENWKRVLRESGFSVVGIGSEDRPTPPLQSVMLAKGPKLASLHRPQPVSNGEERSFLLFVEGRSPHTIGHRTARQLREQGHRVTTVRSGSCFRRLSKDRFQVAPQETSDFARLADTLKSEGRKCEEIVHLWSLTPGELSEIQNQGCLSVLGLVQGLVQAGWSESPRLWLVTSAAHAPSVHQKNIQPAQAPLWGLGRVIMNEHPELGCKLVDLYLDSSRDKSTAAHNLVAELVSPDAEDEILLTGRSRYVHRVRSTSPADWKSQNEPQEEKSFRLEFSAPGSLDNLILQETPRLAVGPGQVEIRVEAAGLNFRDVMWAMGLLSSEALEDGFAGTSLGMECAGEVTAIGEGVTDFRIGAEVIAFAPHSFSTFVVTDSKAVVAKPEHLSFEEAATVLTVFFTAHYALEYLARLREGERVLIHGAAGGVGLAALQMAQHRKAEIFATAGSPEKRDFLRLLGVDHVMDSRTLNFAKEVMEVTESEGVNVVLNSLAGEAIPKTLGLLRPFGRFLEIGKRDFYANSKLGLRPFRNNLSYFGIDADQILIEQPALATGLLQEIMERFEKRVYHPLHHRVFPISRVSQAFRYMQQSKHVGKIVISVKQPVPKVQPRIRKGLRFDGEATYLLTGGLGGFGLATASWMVDKGARHLVLMGRSGAATAEARSAVETLKKAGAKVVVARADVTKEKEVKDLLTRIRSDLPPLRGVLHAAMVLDDGILLKLNRDRFMRAMSPKVFGAWNLHQQTLDIPLDFFVMYSSGTTLVGNPGQANYVAANLYLESLADYRRTLGLPALAVSWGAISEVGYLARNAEVQDLLSSRMGLRGMTPGQALKTLEQLLLSDRTKLAVADFDWRQWRRSAPASASPKYGLVGGHGEEAVQDLTEADFREHILVLSEEERRDFVMARLAEQVGKVLGLPASKIDTGRPIADLGLDSLMSIELHSELEDQMHLNIPVMQLMQGQTINDLANFVLSELQPAGN